MFFVSEVMTDAPGVYKSPLQRMTYEALAALRIPFERVDTDEAISMEDCILINQSLAMQMVKTLVLCNQQKNRVLFICHDRG